MSIADVLIVENDSFNAHHLRRELLKMDYSVCDILASGEQAIERIHQLKPDLILMDIGLDGSLDGIDTAARIGAMRPTPVVFLSAATDETTLTRARKTKPYGYLVKPYSEHTLNATLQMLVERLQTERALRASEARLREAALVFDATQDGILILDHTRRITAVNHRFTEITGYQSADILGSAPHFLNPVDLSAALFEQIEDDLQKGRWSSHIDVLKKTGEIFPAGVTIASVRDIDGHAFSGEMQPDHYVVLLCDLTAVRMAEDKLYRMAHHDTLTGLPNRQLAMDRLRQAIEQAKRRRSRMAVFFIDLDNFKQINDTRGHNSGDELLRTVATRMQACVRSVDTVARLGGDEFLVILDNIDDIKTVSAVAAKILAELAKPLPNAAGGADLVSSGSIGIGLFPEAGTHPDQLIRAADTAMYHAKSRGRNNYSFYTPRMLHSAVQRAEQERRLRHALDRNQLELHYQPVVAMRDNGIVAVEALLRWRHPTRGLLNAERIISLAEAGECMVFLSEWILRSACAQLHVWQQQMQLAALRLTINLSAAQLFDKNFLPILEKCLQEFSLDPRCLEFEVTEATLHSEQARDETFGRLGRLGIGLAVDDFGAGFSSLNALKRLPVRRVKIDRSLVREIPYSAEAIAVVKAIIAMVNALGLTSAAKDIETQEQEIFLRAHGCSEAQGFLYAAPQPAADIVDMLRQREDQLQVLLEARQ